MARIPTSELVNKVFAFCQAYSGVEFFPYQAQFAKRIIRSILENDGEEITALFSRQSGKSETVATVAGGLAILLPTLANMPMFAGDKRLEMFNEGMLIGIFAPALHQAQISFTRMKTRMQSKHAVAVMEELFVTFDTNNGQNIALSNGSVITSMSASEGSNIEGNSYHVIIVDEAQDVSNFKYSKSISPMGAFYNATKILIGTATISKGFFYDSIERNKREYANGSAKRSNFEYDYKYVTKYNPRYASYVEGEKRRLGEDSDEFQMSYGLKWIFERGMFVDGKFEELGNENAGISLMDKHKKHVVGIDFGKRSDSTVVTILEVDYNSPVIIEAAKDVNVSDYVAYNTMIKTWIEITGDNYEEQYPIILDTLANFHIVRVVGDATGAGSAIMDRLAANLECEVIPYSFNQSSKSALYKHFDSEIKSKRFSFPADEMTKETREYQRFIEQMLELQKTYSGQNMVVSHPPERGKHDDYPDSAALAVWGSKGDDISTPTAESMNPMMAVPHSTASFYSSRNQFTARRRR